ncbi:maltodextrin glucosidase [compost metagenome]
MAGNKSDGDAAIRLDFPGGWKGDTNNAFTKAGRNAEQEKFFDFTSKLFQWRKTNEAVHSGKTTHYIPEDNVYVYFRYTNSKTVMVVINNSEKNQTIKKTRFQENIQNFSAGKDVLTNKLVDLKSDIAIESQSALILELQ